MYYQPCKWMRQYGWGWPNVGSPPAGRSQPSIQGCSDLTAASGRQNSSLPTRPKLQSAGGTSGHSRQPSENWPAHTGATQATCPVPHAAGAQDPRPAQGQAHAAAPTQLRTRVSAPRVRGLGLPLWQELHAVASRAGNPTSGTERVRVHAPPVATNTFYSTWVAIGGSHSSPPSSAATFSLLQPLTEQGVYTESFT